MLKTVKDCDFRKNFVFKCVR